MKKENIFSKDVEAVNGRQTFSTMCRHGKPKKKEWMIGRAIALKNEMSHLFLQPYIYTVRKNGYFRCLGHYIMVIITIVRPINGIFSTMDE